MAKQTGVSPSFHYLDDFPLLGPAQSHICLHNLNQLKLLCRQLGIPLALEKVSGPTKLLAFLGIVIDTVRMEVRLPEDKLARIKMLLVTWLTKKNATKRETLSLVGHLQEWENLCEQNVCNSSKGKRVRFLHPAKQRV